MPLLLQTGLLTVDARQPHLCHPPNEYARASLQAMLTSALAGKNDGRQCALEFSALWSSLQLRSPSAFSDAAAQLLRRVPGAMFKGSKAAGGSGGVRESGYHAALAGALVAGAPPGVRVELEASSMSGRADIVVRFGGGLAWVLEIGVGRAGGAEKLQQAQAYGGDQSEEEVLCCSIVVASRASASAAGGVARRVDCAWSKRVRTEPPTEGDGTATTAWCRL